MSNLGAIKRDSFSDVRADILARIVVALALIPEAIGFSIIAGVDPRRAPVRLGRDRHGHRLHRRTGRA